MMKTTKSVVIRLLLGFLAIGVLQFTNAPPHPHQESKATIFFDDWKVKAQWDDEKKQPINLPNLFVLLFIISTIGITATYFSTNFNRDTAFLIPIFHQSNYLLLTPTL